MGKNKRLYFFINGVKVTQNSIKLSINVSKNRSTDIPWAEGNGKTEKNWSAVTYKASQNMGWCPRSV